MHKRGDNLLMQMNKGLLTRKYTIHEYSCTTFAANIKNDDLHMFVHKFEKVFNFKRSKIKFMN